MLQSRLALADDAWLWAYNRDLGESLGGWDSYLRDLTRSGWGRLHRDGCILKADAHDGAGCSDGSIKGPSTVKRSRNDASWVLLDGLAQKPVTVAEEAALKLGPSGREGGLTPPTLPPQATNATFFKLLHWWPGYDFRGGVRGAGSPPLVSFILAKAAPRGYLDWAFGEAWVIACYMIFSGTVVAVYAVSVCWMEARHRKRIEANRLKHAAKREKRAGEEVCREPPKSPRRIKKDD